MSEPGILPQKDLMAILRDVVICYDGTVRDICNNYIIQLKYREDDETDSPITVPSGEPMIVSVTTTVSTLHTRLSWIPSQESNIS
jgi:DNA-directed RNA polymerase V subunit 1